MREMKIERIRILRKSRIREGNMKRERERERESRSDGIDKIGKEEEQMGDEVEMQKMRVGSAVT